MCKERVPVAFLSNHYDAYVGYIVDARHYNHQFTNTHYEPSTRERVRATQLDESMAMNS